MEYKTYGELLPVTMTASPTVFSTGKLKSLNWMNYLIFAESNNLLPPKMNQLNKL